MIKRLYHPEMTIKTVFWISLLGVLSACQPNKHSQTVTFDNIWSSPVRVSKAHPTHFVNEKDEYLYVLNKTAWAYFACEYPEKVLENAKKHGANVIRVCLEGTPYFAQLGYDLWPWGGSRDTPDYTRFNEAYWEEVERRITLAGEHGVGIDLVLYFTLKPTETDIPVQKAYWDRAIRRLSKYSNLLTWEIMNEYVANESFQDSAGTYFKENDPNQHMVCSSDGTTENALWPEKDWMDLAVVHTCTGNQEAYDLESWYLGIAQNVVQHHKPAFNNESGRETRHKNDDPVHRRKQGWLFANSGAYWTWHSWDGCEGINDTTYFMNGWQYLPVMRRYYESIPFWELRPNYTTSRVKGDDLVQTTLSGQDGISITYCCTRETGKKVTGARLDLRIRDGVYQLSFYEPATMKLLGSELHTSRSLRASDSIAVPDFTDDILVAVTKTRNMEKTIIEGTQ